MSAMEAFEFVGTMMSGTSGFIIFWSVLFLIAGLEIITPGRPAETDLGNRLKVNIGLGLMAAVVLAVPFLSEVAFAAFAAEHGWGLFRQWSVSAPVNVVLTFLIYDLFGYALHRIAHLWHPLWRLHRIHHSDREMDLSTLFRTHPIDAVIGVALHLALIAALGLHPLGIVLHELGKLLVMGLGHANVAARPALSRVSGMLFITPALHRVHHSAWQPETDSNFGEVLSIWDRVLGTLRNNRHVARIGLGDRYDLGSASLSAQLRLPFDPR